MTYSMQIKLKDDSLLPFVDSVFAEQGFKKEVKPDGELEYSVEGKEAFNKMFSSLDPFDNEDFVNRCIKWNWVQSENGECIYYEDCIKEFWANESN